MRNEMGVDSRIGFSHKRESSWYSSMRCVCIWIPRVKNDLWYVYFTIIVNQ